MIALFGVAVALVAGLCILAYTLAVYALPLILGVETARWAHASGSGLIGAGLIGDVAGIAAYGLLVFTFASLRSPMLRLIVVLIFATPPPSRTTPSSTASRATPCHPRFGGRYSVSSAAGLSACPHHCGLRVRSDKHATAHLADRRRLIRTRPSPPHSRRHATVDHPYRSAG